MDEKYIQDLYDHLGGQTKFGKFDDFKELISSDPTYRKQFHDSFGDKQLGSYDDFESLVKKKDRMAQTFLLHIWKLPHQILRILKQKYH